jgi:hypothetical protein
MSSVDLGEAGVRGLSRPGCGENDDGSDEMYVVPVRLGTRIDDDHGIRQRIETVSDVSRSGDYRSDWDAAQGRSLVRLDNEFVSGGVLNAHTPEDDNQVVCRTDKFERLSHLESDAQFGRALCTRCHRRMMAGSKGDERDSNGGVFGRT